MNSENSKNRIWKVLVCILFVLAVLPSFPLADVNRFRDGITEYIHYMSLTQMLLRMSFYALTACLLYYVSVRKEQKMKVAEYAMLLLALLILAVGAVKSPLRSICTYFSQVCLAVLCALMFFRVLTVCPKKRTGLTVILFLALIIVSKLLLGAYTN